MSFVFKDAQFVRTQINALIAAYPELEEDATLLADALEGETGLHEILTRLIVERREAETMASAIKEREADLVERRKRFERKADGVKKIMLQLMEVAHQDKVVLTEATLSITKPRESVEVLDLDALPQGTFKLQRVADKAALKAMLMAGDIIPGAQLQIGETGLTVRTR